MNPPSKPEAYAARKKEEDGIQGDLGADLGGGSGSGPFEGAVAQLKDIENDAISTKYPL